MDRPKHRAILGKMLPQLLLLQRVADLPEPEGGGPHQHLQAELGQGHLYWLLVHMVFWVLKNSLARLRLPKPDDAIGLLDVVVHPPYYVTLGHKAKLGKVIFKDIGRDILGKGTNVKPVARRKLTLLHFTMSHLPSRTSMA